MINEKIDSIGSFTNSYYANLRLPLLDLIDWRPKKVLEIGCGSGLTLEHLKENKGAEVVGVEIRPEIAKKITDQGKLDRVWNIDITCDDLPEQENSFDTIILSHVIEHFAQPHSVLEKLKKYASPQARFLIAVPNVRHLSVLGPLLIKGRFEYTDSGILDHTHLRFFTKSSIITFLKKNNFNILHSEFELLGPKSKVLDRLSLGVLRPFCGYAINILAEAC
jgi:2-polyprenyl-3-methyl-5-hydroxy-6-metoxy-1,4-benzoquinol methylase